MTTTPADLRALADRPCDGCGFSAAERNVALRAAADEIERLETRVAYADSDLEERKFWESRYVETRDERDRLAAEVERLQAIADRAEPAFQNAMDFRNRCTEELIVAPLRARVAELEAALKWYADGGSYVIAVKGAEGDWVETDGVWKDRGARARQALGAQPAATSTMVAALSWYADRRNWARMDSGGTAPVDRDMGARARAALGEGEP